MAVTTFASLSTAMDICSHPTNNITLPFLLHVCGWLFPSNIARTCIVRSTRNCHYSYIPNLTDLESFPSLSAVYIHSIFFTILTHIRSAPVIHRRFCSSTRPQFSLTKVYTSCMTGPHSLLTHWLGDGTRVFAATSSVVHAAFPASQPPSAPRGSRRHGCHPTTTKTTPRVSSSTRTLICITSALKNLTNESCQQCSTFSLSVLIAQRQARLCRSSRRTSA